MLIIESIVFHWVIPNPMSMQTVLVKKKIKTQKLRQKVINIGKSMWRAGG